MWRSSLGTSGMWTQGHDPIIAQPVEGWWVCPAPTGREGGGVLSAVAPEGCLRAEYSVLLPGFSQPTHCCTGQEGSPLTLVMFLVTGVGCMLRVGDGNGQAVVEEEGRAVVVDTSFPHHAENSSDSIVRLALMLEFSLEAADDV